ncbi:flagellar hook-associated protein FlgK [Acetonema longum]|uniref:Flagellar hook-associated protein 1 n=1 Tax=Acetonema longum DSM 6540 TaxID=1009370 RepID=F7NNU4_9FIRM|nr:flagellar hook-associated protein FlgK [Acetonema longum]EGO62278.1 flagellar hook-associated protein FlgK [Acetonema longum DSM 6540]
MRSTFGGLGTMVRGLNTQQVALETMGHNIANANTPGYSRQRANMTTTYPQTIYGQGGTFQIGTGVSVQSVTRIRDAFTDKQMWAQLKSLGYANAKSDALARVEDVYREPTDLGLQALMDKFWSAWKTVADNPADLGGRTVLREQGVALANAIQTSAKDLDNLISDINSTIKQKVTRVNEISEEILALNKQISRIEMGDLDHANDLRDRRDLLVDELSQLTGAQVTEDAKGNYIIQAGGATLVDARNTTKLKYKEITPGLEPTDADYGFVRTTIIVDSPGPEVLANFSGGELKGLIESRDVDAKNELDNISTMSKFLLKEFNLIHRVGYGRDDSTAYNFFGAQQTAAPANDNYTDAANWAALFGTATPTDGDWIKALTVNKDLFDEVSGLDRIAAKTANSTDLSVGQSDPNSGAATVGGSYSGSQTKDFEVYIIGRDASGRVTAVEYRTRTNGGAWSGLATATATTTSDPYLFTLSDNMTIRIATDPDNTLGAAGSMAGDRYSFTVSQGYASGDNALRLAEALRSDVRDTIDSIDPAFTDFTFGTGISLNNFYKSAIGTLGVQAEEAITLVERQELVVSQVDVWRQSVSGVNMDEEMTDMIRFQKAYNAASRVVTSIDEMLDKLINSTGIVGR